MTLPTPEALQQLYFAAVEHHRAGQLEQAAPLYRQLLEFDPNNLQVLASLANIEQSLRNPQEAATLYSRALAIEPDFAEVHYNLGTALQQKGDPVAAAHYLSQAIELNPNYVLALNNLGNIHKSRGRFDEAITCYRRVLALEPNNVRTLYNYGFILAELGDRTTARSLYNQALELQPDDPQLLFGVSLLDLQESNLAAGWRGFEHRWRSPDHDTPARAYPQPQWTGEPLTSGRLFLWGEQGIGDEIQFAGLVPNAESLAPSITLQCEPRLHPLFARSFPHIDVIPRGAAPLPEFAAHLPTGSLPSLFRNSSADFARTVSPYLIADPALCQHLRDSYSDGRKLVGIAWHTSGKNTGRVRSIPLPALLPIFKTPNIHWINLQYGDQDLLAQQVAVANAPITVDRTIDQFKDLDRFAAQVAALDLVITIDNSTAHLAGALGVPTCLLLPHVADWRWFLNRPDTPWYPNTRLFRQPAQGDWPSVIADLRQHLA